MWIIKNSKGQYYRIHDPINNYVEWVKQQRSACRFQTKKSAETTSRFFNSNRSVNSRVVKLKCCEKDSLPKPKINTVFINTEFLDFDSEIPNIITSVTDYSDNSDAEVYTLDSIKGEGVYCTLEEYWESVESGAIKIIWEPKK